MKEKYCREEEKMKNAMCNIGEIRKYNKQKRGGETM